MTRRGWGTTLADLARAVLNATLLLVLAAAVAAAVLVAQVRGLARDGARAAQAVLGEAPGALAARLGAALDRLDTLDAHLAAALAGAADAAAIDPLRAEVAAARAEVAALRAAVERLEATAAAAPAAAAARLRAGLAAALAPEGDPP